MQKEIKNANVIIFQCDLTKLDKINNLTQSVIQQFKKIDVLINCAGIAKIKQIQDTTENDFYEVFDNNVKSTIMLTSAVSKHMIHEQYGKIINISSMWGIVGASMESLYSASKAAINTFTRSLAKELGPSNITVNSICPGLIDTKMNSCLTKETIDEIVNYTPLKRIGKPEDVANLVEFLIDEKSNFITGQIISVDGGFIL